MGRDSRPRHALLSSQDRLPPYLVTPQRTSNNTLQRRTNRKHTPLCLAQSFETPTSRSRDSSSITTNSLPLPTNDRSQPPPSPRLRPNRNIRPHHKRLHPPRMARLARQRQVREDGTTRARLLNLLTRSRDKSPRRR